MRRGLGNSTRGSALLLAALMLAAPILAAPPSVAGPPGSRQLDTPWDGNPISAGLGPTYGEQWCEPPAPGSSEEDQQGAPLALIPESAIKCTLEKFTAEAKTAEVPKRMSYSVIGESVRGRDLYGVVVNAMETPEQRRDYKRWLELRSTMLKDPQRAQSLLGKWGANIKIPIFVESNIHGDEEEGTDAIMQVLRDLVTTPSGTHPDIDNLLDHAFLIVHPSINPDGRYLGTRRNANGFDLNRDLMVQGQPEVKASISHILEWLPPVGLTMHGYTSGVGAIQGMTKPHNPGYEYDKILSWNQRRTEANLAHLDAVGQHPVRQVNDWNANAATSPEPTGPAHAEGWDDWGPFYVAGHASTWALDIQTIEMCDRGPGCDGRFGSKRMQYVSFYSSADFWTDNRNAILHDQLEIFRRGDADEERVNCCDDPFVAERGFTEDQHNWAVEYPKAYVIPFDGAPAGSRSDAQRADAEANRLVQWLLDNGVEVTRMKRDFTWGATLYNKGSYVVWMDQPFRGLALTTLSVGQDISDRIARLYAPPGAWSPGHIWGADVVEVPRGDPAFDPGTTSISRTSRLSGGIRGGSADWYAVNLRGPAEVRAVFDVLRDGVRGRVAEAPFESASAGRLPAGSLIFPDDRETVRALNAAGKAAGFFVERGKGDPPPAQAMTKVPRVAVLVNSAQPAMDDTLWGLQRTFGSDAEFVSVVAGSGSLQNAATDPLSDVDVIYNAGQNYPAQENATARDRLQAFFKRGGGYIATSQSANNFAFLNDSALIEGELQQQAQRAYGGIAKWANVGRDGPLSGAYPTEDFLYLPTDVTYFSSLPDGAVVDGTYLNSTDELFVAGLWRGRQNAAAGAPVIAHGETNVDSRYVAFASNPFSRGDAERVWTLMAQAALWSTLTDD